jgi:hypothetical protein
LVVYPAATLARWDAMEKGLKYLYIKGENNTCSLFDNKSKKCKVTITSGSFWKDTDILGNKYGFNPGAGKIIS